MSTLFEMSRYVGKTIVRIIMLNDELFVRVRSDYGHIRGQLINADNNSITIKHNNDNIIVDFGVTKR